MKRTILVLSLILLFPLLGMAKHFNRPHYDADAALLNELRSEGYVILPEIVVVAYRDQQDTINKPMKERKHNHGNDVSQVAKETESGPGKGQIVGETARQKGIEQHARNHGHMQKPPRTMHGRPDVLPPKPPKTVKR